MTSKKVLVEAITR